MNLPDAYLEYPKRRPGMDHDLYSYRKLGDHPPFMWEGGKTVATMIVVSLEWFPIVPDDKPFKAPGHMLTAYPDYRHYTSRDYGTRVGIDRLLDAFDHVDAKAGFATNAAVAKHYPEVVDEIVSRGHEIIAHSTDMNGTIATGLEVDAERTLITTSLDTLEGATGKRPSGWLSIARSQSWSTLQLLVEAGVSYTLDWVNDELPYPIQTPAGAISNVPLNHELSDRQVITVQQNSSDAFCEQLEDAWAWLEREASETGAGRMLPIHLTPYIIGLPYRIGSLERLLDRLANHPTNGFLRPGEVFQQWKST